MATLCLPFADVFPDVDEAHDPCVVRLVATLEAHDGIALAHVVTGPAGAPVRLCVHHDPAVAEADDVRDTVDALSESQRTHFGHVHAWPGSFFGPAERLAWTSPMGDTFNTKLNKIEVSA